MTEKREVTKLKGVLLEHVERKEARAEGRKSPDVLHFQVETEEGKQRDVKVSSFNELPALQELDLCEFYVVQNGKWLNLANPDETPNNEPIIKVVGNVQRASPLKAKRWTNDDYWRNKFDYEKNERDERIGRQACLNAAIELIISTPDAPCSVADALSTAEAFFKWTKQKG